MRDWLATVWHDKATLDFPELGISGSVFDIKRALSNAFCVPRRQIRHNVQREMGRLGLRSGRFAAVHVRRGDKIRPETGPVEGEATTPAAYIEAIRRHAPEARDISC